MANESDNPMAALLPKAYLQIASLLEFVGHLDPAPPRETSHMSIFGSKQVLQTFKDWFYSQALRRLGLTSS